MTSKGSYALNIKDLCRFLHKHKINTRKLVISYRFYSDQEFGWFCASNLFVDPDISFYSEELKTIGRNIHVAYAEK
jgi:hypothetical protein